MYTFLIVYILIHTLFDVSRCICFVMLHSSVHYTVSWQADTSLWDAYLLIDWYTDLLTPKNMFLAHDITSLITDST